MSEQRKPILIATAGHIDHGKSSLIRALTGTDPDRLPEEKERGITIVPGYAHLSLEGSETLSFVDVPGHERFLHHMIQGAQGIRFVMLVIAADDGVMPQTLEHLEVARLLGAKAGVVVITKTDLVDEDWVELVIEDLKSTLDGTFLQDAPIVPFSTQKPEEFPTIQKQIVSLFSGLTNERECPSAGANSVLPVDRVMSFSGRGLVVTGTLAKGTLSVGSAVSIVPGDHEGRIRELQVHGATVDEATGPTRVAMNLAGVSKEDLSIGAFIVPHDEPSKAERVWLASFQSTRWIREPLKFPLRGLLHVGTTRVEALIQNLAPDNKASWNETIPVRVRLDEELYLPAGRRFVFRVSSEQGRAGCTIGGGSLYVGGAPAKRARAKRDQAALQKILEGAGAPFVRGLIELHHPQVISLDALCPMLAIPRNEVRAIVDDTQELMVQSSADGELVFPKRLWEHVKGELVRAVCEHHKARPQDPGASRAELRGLLSKDAPESVIDAALNALHEAGLVRIEGAFASSPEHTAVLSPSLQQFGSHAKTILERGGLAPPTLSAMATKLGCDERAVREIMTFMVRSNAAVRISSDYFVLAEQHQAFEARVRAHFTDHDVLSIDELRGLSGGLSRKYLVPLAEDLDRRHVTVRVGNERKAGGTK